MKIFGIGLTRTGTTSLTEALKMLGYSAVHQPLSYEEIKKHQASTDTAIAARFPILDVFYPNSKFILTTRDKDSWIKSAALTPRHSNDLLWLLEGRAILYKTTTFDKKKFMQAYDDYHDLVHNYFSGRCNDLLILDLKEADKWGKLCDFLSKPIPTIDYPHLNKGLPHE
jgi:hypothetical protein